MLFRQHMFKNRFPLMNRALDAYALRQQTTSKNIANSTSPHYRPERVRFEELFHKQSITIRGAKSDEAGISHIPIGRTSDEDIPGDKIDREIPEPEIFFSGETHVNIDKEMSEMAQNQIRFRFASSRVKGVFNKMTSAIRGTPVG